MEQVPLYGGVALCKQSRGGSGNLPVVFWRRGNLLTTPLFCSAQNHPSTGGELVMEQVPLYGGVALCKQSRGGSGNLPVIASNS